MEKIQNLNVSQTKKELSVVDSRATKVKNICLITTRNKKFKLNRK